MELIKQTKGRMWLGGLQVQVSNSMFYMNLISTAMMILTFWYTAGYQIQGRYAQWLNLWMFIGFVILVFVAVMILDYIFVLPSRQAFTNEQACKHENPAMDELYAIRKENAELKQELIELKEALIEMKEDYKIAWKN